MTAQLTAKPVTTGDGRRRPRHRHSPLIRRLADENGVDPDGIPGSGPSGRVRRTDVLAAAERSSRAVATGSPDRAEVFSSAPSRGIERAPIADATSAGVTSLIEADMTAVARLIGADNQRSPRLTWTAFVAQAALMALRAHPRLATTPIGDEDAATHPGRQHLAVAVDTAQGVVVPVILDAGDLNLAGLARRLSELADRAHAGQVGRQDCAGATFTVADTCSRGTLFDTPVLEESQTAVLGVGAVVERPVVVRDRDGSAALGIRPMAYLTLTYDHRRVDGAEAARFLAAVKQRLEKPDPDASIRRA